MEKRISLSSLALLAAAGLDSGALLGFPRFRGGAASYQPVPNDAGDVEMGPAFRTPVRQAKPIGRNEPCPCGCGRKFKKCPARQKGA